MRACHRVIVGSGAKAVADGAIPDAKKIAQFKNALALGKADKKTFAALDDIDARILKSGIKDVAALVFPTEREFDALVKKVQ